MDRSHGFTLMEVITVVAIVAILAALAAQSYTRYAFRSRRTDAHQALAAIAQAQERWYAAHNRYTADLADLGYVNPALSPHGYYEVALSVDGDDGQDFVVTAMPIHQQANDACGNLSIDHAGYTRPDKADVAANANGRCW
ncbi:type IV pilin protein [Dyella monticola]|nr:type IV pilin protein [Dyella monticola]